MPYSTAAEIGQVPSSPFIIPASAARYLTHSILINMTNTVCYASSMASRVQTIYMSLGPLLFTGNHWGQLPSCQVPMEEAKREAKEHLGKRHRKGNKRDGIHQDRDGEDGHRQTSVTFIWRWICSKRANRHK